jgi:serine/threonine-protein kinase
MAHVITQEPKLDKIPAPVQRILKACLEKDPKKRLRDIGDVWRLMEESSTVLPSALVEAKSKRPWLWPAVAAVFVLIAAALAFVHFRETPPATPALRATILPPPGMVLDTIDGLGLPAVSPDGRRVVFGARREW